MATAEKVKKEEKKETPKRKRRRIPKELIYEMRHGSPIYYRDYDLVLSGEKSLEEVMGSSGLQSYLITLIISLLYPKLKKMGYIVLGNEVGYKFAPKSWYNLDIAVWEKDKVKPYLKKDIYVEVPPKVVIEVDTKADLRKFTTPMDYFHRKTKDLLEAGTERVIWIFTKEKKVWIAEKGKPWLIVDWDYKIPILEGITITLKDLVEEEENG